MKKCYEVMAKSPAYCLQNDAALKAAELIKSKNVNGQGNFPSQPVVKVLHG